MPRWLKRIKWRLEFGVLYALFLFSRVVPHSLLLRTGRLLGLFVWHVLRIRRGVVLDNLRAAFGDRMDEPALRSLARRFYANLGLTLMEFFTFHRFGLEDVVGITTIEGLEHVEECRRRGRGALLVSCHLGNWELLGAAVAARGYPVRYLIKSQSNPHVDRMQNEIRRRIGIEVIRQGASARRLVYALRRGKFVGLLADQDGGNQGEFVEFLGRQASVFRGTAYFAYRTQSPIIAGAIFRQPDGRHRVVLTPPIEVDPAWDEATAVRELTRRHTERLAGFIRQAPEHYFWVHRRWKTRPSAEQAGPLDAEAAGGPAQRT